jgi:phosphoribosyl 1,2-cyclic phosphate phosphodiesterase
MELLLLGSAAAEGFPAPFCLCDSCQQARRRGGTNIRSRSGALIDDDLKIDFSGDTVMQMQRCGRTLARVRTILFTHQHEDHLAAVEMLWASRPFTNTPPDRPIVVYGNEGVMEEVLRAFPDPAKINLDLRLLRPLEAVTTAGGDVVLPLPADHEKGALVLRIARAGKTVFYGHDSGLYPKEALDAVSDGVTLDVALLDCTNGALGTANRGHMGIDGVLKMVDELRRRGAISDRTRLIATHFSHNGKLLHEELVRALMPHGIEAAFDGMAVNV